MLQELLQTPNINEAALDEGIEICPTCGDPMYPVYENNGYDPSEGPTMNVFTGWECINKYCGQEEY